MQYLGILSKLNSLYNKIVKNHLKPISGCKLELVNENKLIAVGERRGGRDSDVMSMANRAPAGSQVRCTPGSKSKHPFPPLTLFT